MSGDLQVARVGLVAAVFGRLPLRIGVADGAKTGALLADMTRERFGLRAGQLTSASRPAVANASATIEVLSR